MGTMNRMRENTGIVLWILVLSFGGLWVLQDSGVFETIGANPLAAVIVVDGDEITLEQYNRQLEAQLEQIRQQTGETVLPQQLEVQRERAFNALVENTLRVHEMDRLGVSVSNTEVMELITGENPHEIIRLYFSNDAGGVNRALLQSVIEDPEQEPLWLQIEEYVRLDRRSKKFDALTASTVRVSEVDIEDYYNLEARSATAEFFFLRYADIPDDSVSIEDRDLRRYYNDNREDYRTERLYSIQIATISKEPNSQDTLAVMRELERLRPGLEASENDSLFVAQSGSETPWSSAWTSPADVGPVLATALFESGDISAGQVLGPFQVGNQVQIVKVVDVRPAEETNVRARHILARLDENNLAAARVKINEVRQRLDSGEDFAAVARQVSDDPGSGQNGGDLGWFGPGAMVAPFEDAAFAARDGVLVGPVETQFGMHLIEVTHRASQDLQLATISFTLDASVATLNAIEESLEDLKYYAEEEGDFTAEAQRRGIALLPMQVQEDQISLPQIGITRSVPTFLKTARVGDISPVIELDEISIVVHVTAIEEEGYELLEEVEGSVMNRTLLEKKRILQVERLRAAYAEGGFDGLAEALGIPAQTAPVISFEQSIVSGIGRDYEFVGTVLGLAVGEDSGVIEGENGAYVVRTTAINEPVPISDSERDRLRSEITRRQEMDMRREWINTLREAADIQDLRSDLLVQQ